ncbi:TPA: nitroreductase, partial [Enterobacter cloacae]
IDKVHGGDMALAQKMLIMEAKRLNISVNVEADKSRD